MNALNQYQTTPQYWGNTRTHTGAFSLASGWGNQSPTPESIRDEYAPKLRQLQQAAQLAKANGQAATSISLMFDLVSEEAWMVRSMAASVGGSLADFDDQRFIRRADIDALMACAQEVGDCDAKLLAEVLLQNQQRHMAVALAPSDGQDGLFASA